MHAIVSDVDTATGVDTLAQQVLAEHPGVNVLVNNAGIRFAADPTCRPTS